MPEQDKSMPGRKEEILQKAKENFQLAIELDRDNRNAAIEDLEFLYLPESQWDEAEKKRREIRKRPILQVSILQKYVKQVVGEMRRNKVKIKVRPIDSEGDIELANIREGVIYNIEYQSNAESIYDHAGKMMVECGYGAWRIGTRFINSKSFDQEIYFERIENPLSVYMDPYAKDQNFADAKWGGILDKMSRDDFEKTYPKSIAPSAEITGGQTLIDQDWYDKDTVTIADYYCIETERKKIALLSDGRIIDYKDAEEEINGWRRIYDQRKTEALAGNGDMPDESQMPRIIKDREIEEPQIKFYRITANDILEEKKWPGRFIPIILMIGEETNIKGKKHIQGLIRNGKDSQKLLNYWHTALCETVALAPKSQWLGTQKMFEDVEVDFANAHEENLPYLKFTHDSERPGDKPTRVSPGQVSPALFQEVVNSKENIKDAIGMFNADVGDQGREVSGFAMQMRQLPGDTATFVYLDNQARAITHCGRIALDLIPKIMDGERDARLRNIDDTENFAPINTTAGRALEILQKSPERFAGMDIKRLQKEIKTKGEEAPYNDMSVGQYDVIASTGPAFETQRMAAADNMVKIAMASGTMNPLDKYFLVKNMDWPGSDEYAEAIRKTVPPGLLPPKPGEQPPQPPPPPPPDPVQMAELEVKKLDRQLQIEKMKTERARQRVALTKMYNETQQSETKIRAEIMKTLNEIEKTYQPQQTSQTPQNPLLPTDRGQMSPIRDFTE